MVGHLCERFLDGSAASEGTSANDRDHGKHEGEGDPAHPSECLESFSRVAVREGVSKVRTAESATSSVGEGSGASEPEDPGHEEGDGMTGNRGDNTANASKEETSLLIAQKGRQEKKHGSVPGCQRGHESSKPCARVLPFRATMLGSVRAQHSEAHSEERCAQVMGTHVDNADEEAPPAGKEKEAGSVVDAHAWRIVVLVVIGDERRRDNSSDECEESEDQEGDGVAPTDG